MTAGARRGLGSVRGGQPARLVLLMTAAAAGIFSLTIPGFASAGNLEAVLISAVPLLLLAVGGTFVLISAGIDLSSPFIVGLASVVGGLVMTGAAGGGDLSRSTAGVAAMIAVGLLAGLFNGACVAWLRMPPFMVTLTSGMFAGGLAVLLARAGVQDDDLHALPRAFLSLGGTGGAAVGMAGVATLLAHGALAETQFGRLLRAVGFNARAAHASGVPVERVVCAAYVASGALAGLAGLLLTGQLEAASPTHGRQLLLDVIGAIVIGGTSLSGGRGTVTGTALGVLFLAVLGNGLTLLNLSDFVITMVKGLLILGAALLDAWRGGWGDVS